ncbi:MAG: glycosyltransferase, partial [Acetobacteraceae bacterium]|nr:glycosyltransferase [Acetobacteraceae bacterium]
CYVSLHRAEGFSLTAAEAMLLGKPVVATRYSGNLEFMTAANSYLVNYEMAPIRVSNPIYPPDGEWADPHVEHAARLLREVFEHPDEARRRAERGAAELHEAFSPNATGEAMLRRLLEIREQRSQAPSPEDRPAPGRDLHTAPTGNAQGVPVRGPRPWQQVPVRQILRALASSRGQWRELSAGILLAWREVLAEAVSRRRDGTSRGPGTAGVEISALLAELRRQDALLRTLRAELAILKRDPKRSEPGR